MYNPRLYPVSVLVYLRKTPRSRLETASASSGEATGLSRSPKRSRWAKLRCTVRLSATTTNSDPVWRALAVVFAPKIHIQARVADRVAAKGEERPSPPCAAKGESAGRREASGEDLVLLKLDLVPAGELDPRLCRR
ncbi:unnamed protein product [Urochloa humidicola]